MMFIWANYPTKISLSSLISIFDFILNNTFANEKKNTFPIHREMTFLESWDNIASAIRVERSKLHFMFEH